MKDGIVNIGDLCTHCGRDTSFGSRDSNGEKLLLFVNRIPSFTDGRLILAGWTEDEEGNESDITMDISLDGYMCPECQLLKCDTCKELTDDYVLDGKVTCRNCVEGDNDG